MANQEASTSQREAFYQEDVSMELADESDDELDWEEIAVLAAPSGSADINDGGLLATNAATNYKEQVTPDQATNAGNIEITLKRVKAKGKAKDEARKKKAEEIAQLRALRLICHKIHTVSLLSSALARNKWLNDPLLHARLLSLLPNKYHTSFQMITKKQYPDAAKRGRLFETAIMRLTQWWYETFDVLDEGHARSYTFGQVQKFLAGEASLDDEGEVMRSSKSLMKRALLGQGSRDVSAQLFTALCRALDIPARLVISLQSVPWQASVGKPKAPSRKRWDKTKKSNGNGSAVSHSDYSDEDDMEEVLITEPTTDRKGKGKAVFPGEGSSLSNASTTRGKGKGKARLKPAVKLRKSKSSGQRLGSSPSLPYGPPQLPSTSSIGGPYPVYWTEVFSKPDGKWMPIDPVRYIVNKRRVFEPPASDEMNRMVYVVAVEEDGYCRDVTPRYAKDYAAKTSKAQLGGKGKREWWESLMALVTRPYRLNRDDVEDMEFETNQYREGMPTSVAGFKDHPIYALKQHLKREEVIHPEVELGKFRGEPVYPRANVVQLKTAENWMRQGRRVKEGEQAMKWVKQRAVTIHRRRAMELAQQDGDEMLQGLYSEAQTEVYVPDPVSDGIVPKNDFGNIDLYTPSMLPAGAAHIPYKGVAKIARKLGFDYAEAVTSFEFKKGRAFPVLSGIVVATENEQTILEAYWETERDAEERERKKRMDRIIKRWTRLIQGLRLRQRLQEQYGGSGSGEPLNPVQHEVEQGVPAEPPLAGGFLTDADTVVQPFHLPRFEHGEYNPRSNDSGASVGGDEFVDEPLDQGGPSYTRLVQPFGPSQIGESDRNNSEDNDLDELIPRVAFSVQDAVGSTFTNTNPKSMLQLAEEAELKRGDENRTPRVVTTTPASDSMLTAQGRAHTPKGKDNCAESKSSRKTLQAAKSRTGKNPRRSIANALKGESIEEDSKDLWGPGVDSEVAQLVSQRGQIEKSSTNSLKRKRKNAVPATPTPPSTRVLRPRAPKPAEKVRAEKEAEEAYRNAVAE